MILTKDTLKVGMKIARIMLLASDRNTVKTIVSDIAVILDITNEYDETFGDNQLKYSYSDGHPKSTPQWGYVGDLLGRDETVICVPFEELELYNNPDAFGLAAHQRVLRETYNYVSFDPFMWADSWADSRFEFPADKY